MNHLLAMLFLGGAALLIGFPLFKGSKWLYRTTKAEHRRNYKFAFLKAREALIALRLAAWSFGWRKLVLLLLIALVLLATLPITIDRADYAIRSTIIRRKMVDTIDALEQYQGEEPWQGCNVCPYERGSGFGWEVWDWAYGETPNGEAAIFVLFTFLPPKDIEDQIWLSLYYYPGFRGFMSDMGRHFPGARAFYLATGPNLGPMVYKGKKYPVVTSDYLAFKVEAGEYEWVELSQLQIDRAMTESLIITQTLFFGPQVHGGFLDPQIALPHWYERINWEVVWKVFVSWLTRGTW